MPKLERILCPVDFSEFSEWAYRHALSLSDHFGAKLFVQNVVELWQHPSISFAPSECYAPFRTHLLNSSRQELHDLVMRVPCTGARPHCVVREGVAPDAILSFAEEDHMDLIVMGTHGRRGFDRLMIGSVAERVLRNSHCPVLVVHGSPSNAWTCNEGQVPSHPGPILYCTDFSENSQQAFDYATLLAREYNSELILVNVLEEVPNPSALEDMMAKATDRLQDAIPLVQKGCGRHKTIVRVGKPYQQILAMCIETKCDLVVMAVRGASAFDLSIFGSTTHRVIQLASCPILAVPV
jgi:nucleotide-binding universal stress UspA family protein